MVEVVVTLVVVGESRSIARGLTVGPAASPFSSFSPLVLFSAAPEPATSPHGGISPPRARKGPAGPPTTPHHRQGKCISCVARCSLRTGRFTRGIARIQISSCRARAREREPRGGRFLPPHDDLSSALPCFLRLVLFLAALCSSLLEEEQEKEVKGTPYSVVSRTELFYRDNRAFFAWNRLLRIAHEDVRGTGIQRNPGEDSFYELIL